MEFDWLKGFTFLIQGKCFDILGDRRSAIKAYKQVMKMDRYYPEVEEGKAYLKEPYIPKLVSIEKK